RRHQRSRRPPPHRPEPRRPPPRPARRPPRPPRPNHHVHPDPPPRPARPRRPRAQPPRPDHHIHTVAVDEHHDHHVVRVRLAPRKRLSARSPAEGAPCPREGRRRHERFRQPDHDHGRPAVPSTTRRAC